DLRRALGRLGAEVALVDVAALVDDEGHHAGLAVGHRPGDDAEAAAHAAVHQVAVGAARSVGALAIEQAVAIAVIALTLGVARLRLGDQRAERALRLAGL